MAGAAERLAHVEELRPEICTLDCGTMNFAAGGDYIMANTPAMLRAMARRVQELGVRPELEVFDTGQLVLVNELVARRADRRSAADPALHGDPLRRPRRPRDAARDGRPAARATPCSRRSRSGACSSPTPRSRRSSARTSASASRTTCTSRGAGWRRTPSSSSARWGSSTAMNVPRARARRGARAAARWLSASCLRPVPAARSGCSAAASSAAAGRPASLLNGVDVRLYDPDPDAPRKRARRCWPTRAAPTAS